MTETLSPSLAAVFAAGAASAADTADAPSLADLLVPVPSDWGWHDCQRLATEAELAACGRRCQECGGSLCDKHGWLAGGTVIGRRPHRDAEFTWSVVLCRKCEVAHSIADGYK